MSHNVSITVRYWHCEDCENQVVLGEAMGWYASCGCHSEHLPQTGTNSVSLGKWGPDKWNLLKRSELTEPNNE